MTAEEFFVLAEKHPAILERDRSVSLTIYKEDEEDGGGYRADAMGTCAYGDTVAEAIAAAFDHVTGAPSKRDRLNRPFCSSDREAHRWDKAFRCGYDYRKTDWRPPSPAPMTIRKEPSGSALT